MVLVSSYSEAAINHDCEESIGEMRSQPPTPHVLNTCFREIYVPNYVTLYVSGY